MAWELTGEAFARLLDCFDSNPDVAGNKYGKLRTELIEMVFERYGVRSTPDLEELADATFDRVAKKLSEGVRIESIGAYSSVVARNILKEYWKAQRNRPEPLEPDHLSKIPPVTQEEDSRADCLDHCLNVLPPETAAMVIEYHHGDDERSAGQRRLELSLRLGIPVEALRNRIVRLRNKLEKCINDCQNKQEQQR